MWTNDGRVLLRRHLAARVRDPRVIEALLSTPRERYVPSELEQHAWEDRALPFAEGQTISQPTMIALMLEALEPGPTDTVLDVGTGSGYQAAVLSRLVRRVFGIELLLGLARRARQAWQRDAGLARPCELVVADAHLGFPGRVLFDGIVVAAAAEQIPTALLEQLAPGGRLVAPLGPPSIQELVRVRRAHDGSLGPLEPLGGCAFVPLVRGRE